jgi:YHS domain-containing protein
MASAIVRRVAVAALFGALVLNTAGLASAGSVHHYDLTGEDIGLAGFDPVSYFPEGGGQPQKGSIQISAVHDGVTYRFASKDHLELFQKSPEKYLPAFGGWCAWAVAELGKRVDVDPLSFVVRDGRLYVFYRDPGFDTRAMWLKDPAAFVTKGDAKWPEVSR